MTSLRDALLAARFEVLRAIRTWRALALVAVFMVATVGGHWMFTRVLLAFENQLGATLGVPAVETPGAMIDRILEMDELRAMIALLVGDPTLLDHVLAWPLTSVYHLWLGLLLLPFLSATSAAECISIDLGSRALRFELVRTGRLELVLGRLVGQAVLTGLASGLGVLGAWGVGMFGMVGNDPVELAIALCGVTLRAWAFGLPFVGLGVAVSQLTAAPAWARVLAVGGTAGSWVAFGAARWAQREGYAPVLWDALLPLLPQTWIRGLWEPGAQFLISIGVFVALAFVVTGLGFVRMARRDV